MSPPFQNLVPSWHKTLSFKNYYSVAAFIVVSQETGAQSLQINAELWLLQKRQIQQSLCFEGISTVYRLKVGESVFGEKFLNVKRWKWQKSGRKLQNEELCNLYSSRNVKRMTLSIKTIPIVHTENMAEKEKAYMRRVHVNTKTKAKA
jgi:hypothetical protein